MATDMLLYAQFVASKAGKTSLGPTIDIWKVAKADSTVSSVVTGGATTEVGRGVYVYRLASATPLTHDYVGVFVTADATVDAKEIPSWRGDFTESRSTEIANLDATISSRLAAASYTVPPTAAANADAVWDEAISGHAATGSTGAALSAAGGAGDPLLNAVPGAYATGSAGAALGRIGSNTVTVVSPVNNDGDISLTYGDDYYTTDAQSLSFTGTNWPVITGGTVALRVQGTNVVSIAGTVTSGSACVVEVTQANTYSIGVGVWAYDLEATLSNSHVRTLQRGLCTVAQDVR